MSTPIPSPSMNGMMGLSGTGLPGAMRSPAAGTLINEVAIVRVKANGSVSARVRTSGGLAGDRLVVRGNGRRESREWSLSGRPRTQPRAASRRREAAVLADACTTLSGMRAAARGTDAADGIAELLVAGFDESYRRFRRDQRGGEGALRACGLGRGRSRGAGTDPARGRAGRPDDRGAARRHQRAPARRSRVAPGQAPLRRAARRPQAAGARGDVLQLRLDARARRGPTSATS